MDVEYYWLESVRVNTASFHISTTVKILPTALGPTASCWFGGECRCISSVCGRAVAFRVVCIGISSDSPLSRTIPFELKQIASEAIDGGKVADARAGPLSSYAVRDITRKRLMVRQRVDTKPSQALLAHSFNSRNMLLEPRTIYPVFPGG